MERLPLIGMKHLPTRKMNVSRKKKSIAHDSFRTARPDHAGRIEMGSQKGRRICKRF